MSGRRHRPEVVARLVLGDDGGARLVSPGVGLYRAAPKGTLVTPGAVVGELEVLGELFTVRAPDGAHGLAVDETGGVAARRPVGYGDLLLLLDAEVTAGTMADDATEDSGDGAALVYRSPTSGRYYARPAPDAEPFVVAGAEVEAGQTVALLEVMKTFNRVQFGGAGLPERARVIRIVPENESDLEAGDAILELERID